MFDRLHSDAAAWGTGTGADSSSTTACKHSPTFVDKNELRKTVIGLVLPALYRGGKPFWNPTVNRFTANVLDQLQEWSAEEYSAAAMKLFAGSKPASSGLSSVVTTKDSANIGLDKHTRGDGTGRQQNQQNQHEQKHPSYNRSECEEGLRKRDRLSVTTMAPICAPLRPGVLPNANEMGIMSSSVSGTSISAVKATVEPTPMPYSEHVLHTTIHAHSPLVPSQPLICGNSMKNPSKIPLAPTLPTPPPNSARSLTGVGPAVGLPPKGPQARRPAVMTVMPKPFSRPGSTSAAGVSHVAVTGVAPWALTHATQAPTPQPLMNEQASVHPASITSAEALLRLEHYKNLCRPNGAAGENSVEMAQAR